MSYKDKYKKINSAYGSGSLRDAYIDNTKATIMHTFLNNPSAKLIRFDGLEEEQWVWIVEDTKNPTTKRIVMPPDKTIEAGSLVNWKNEKWICIFVDKSNSEIYESGYIEKCNSELKWVDEHGIIQSFPSVFYYGTRANFGTFSDKVMTLPDGRRQVVVQKNEHTIKLKRDDRFMFGGSVFKVIDFDHVNDEGLVNLNLKDDLFNPARDNKELGIADYYKSLVNYEVEILNGSNIQLQIGESLKLQVIAKKDGEVVQNPALSYLSTDESVLIVDDEGIVEAVSEGIAEVYAMYQSAQTSVMIEVAEEVIEDNYSIVIKSTSNTPNEIRKNQSKTYYGEVYKNGVLVEDKSVVFEIYSDNQTDSTNLAIIQSQDGKSCVIKNNDSTSGWVYIRCFMENGIGVESWTRVQMKNLF